MPEVKVRKRSRRRPKKTTLRERIGHWFYENRPQIVVVCAFVVAGLVGAIAVGFGLHVIDGQSDSGVAAVSN